MTQPSMLNFRTIAHATRELAANQPEYENLFIRDEVLDDGSNIMVSEWAPTPEQLKALNNGGSIFLGIIGDIHPPVMVLAGDRTTVEGIQGDDATDEF